MIDELGAWARSSALGPITEAVFDGFSLSIAAGNWAFSTTSSWRIVSEGVLVAASADVEAAQNALEAIRAATLVDVVPQSRLMLGDPTLVLSGGSALEVFSDTQVDPWSMTTPEMIYVGAPGDPRYSR